MQALRSQAHNAPYGLFSSRGLATSMASMAIRSRVQQAVAGTGSWTLKEILFAALALTAGASSAAVMVLEGGLLNNTVAGLCIVCGSTVVVLQKKLTSLETFRQLNNEAQEEIEELEGENERLAEENDEMQEATRELQQAEAALEVIGAAQQMGVNNLIEQVEQYRLLQQELKTTVNRKTLDTVIDVVLKTDIDDNYLIDRREIDILCKALDSMPNVRFNEQAFRTAMREEGGSVVKFSKKHLRYEAFMEGAIFQIIC